MCPIKKESVYAGIDSDVCFANLEFDVNELATASREINFLLKKKLEKTFKKGGSPQS